ncbi:MAG: ACR3 family arsenite efflux transporter [Kordiimonadaceae bacterium]|nr:ACR3 family arsenite efflux transporter [Kordiimonadaceae bacterium]
MEDQKNSPLGTFGRYLSLWVGLSIICGILLGNIVPGLFSMIASLEYANVNMVVAVLIWIMIYPMMTQIDFTSLKDLGSRPRGLLITLVINWLIKPFSMAAIGVLFFEYIYIGLVSVHDAKEYIAGMILLGVAPCTAMVFVWSQLTRGDAGYTLVQVSINDLIMIFAFAPIAAFLLDMTDIIVPWQTLFLSVLLYVVIPLAAGALTRRMLVRKNDLRALNRFTKSLEPWSMIGLLATVVILFGLQAETILAKPLIILLIAMPLIIQTYGIFAIAYGWAYFWKIPHNVAAPAAMIGTSNFFELAVAVAISLFGLDSGAALATVVGVLVEVPVMLSLVSIANRTRNKFA